MPEERWAQLMEINLSSEERINDALLEAGLLRANGRIVCVSSMSGIAGNSGQTNYATSKAGVIGMVEAMAPELAGARGDDQRGRPRLHRDEDDGGDADRPARSRPPAQQPLPGRPAGRRRRDDRLVRQPRPRPGSTATSVRVCGQNLLGAWMATRVLDSPPSILPLYARAAAPMIPGASLLPFVPGGGGEIPELELELAGVRADPPTVAAYARVCGFALRDHLPPTYPHVLAFPLHMAVMADGGFPFGAVGLVHVENRIVQHRPIGIDEELTLRVAADRRSQPHPKGRTFSLVTEARVGGELGLGERQHHAAPRQGRASAGAEAEAASRPLARRRRRPRAEWRLGGDLGRRYAAVSGDRNPIHMHSLTAKPLGFPAAIAHGMWTKARCLAALESRLPDAFARRRPLPQADPAARPGRVRQRRRRGEIAFAVRDAQAQTPHLDGRVTRAARSQGRNQPHRKEESE